MTGRAWTAALSSAAFIFASCLTLILACAEVKPPPGGEPDRTPPFLVQSIPQNGAINVPSGNRVELLFSERIVEPRAGRAVFVSPRQSKEPKVKFLKNQIEVVLPDSFAAGATYIVSLSSEITDLRGNRVDSNLSVAFSTGPTIDSGSVSGFVMAENHPQAGLLVGLYDESSFDDSVIIDSLLPDYIAYTTSTGYFSFQFLPKKAYRLIAYRDKNGNERLSPEREAFALPDRRIDLSENLPLDSLYLELTTQDTLLPQVISSGFSPNRLLKVRLSKEIDLAMLRLSPANALLKSKENQARVFPASAFVEQNEERSKVITLYLGDPEIGDYVLEVMYDAQLPMLVDSQVTIMTLEDQVPPTIVSTTPDKEVQFVDEVDIGFVFSEPLDTLLMSAGSFMLLDQDSADVPLEARWINPLRLQLTPKALSEGGRYRLLVAQFELADLAGNVLGDSLYEYTFETFDSEELGSISGSITVGVPNEEGTPAALTFRQLGGRTFETTTTGRSFAIAVPPGDYLLSGFLDSDLDGKRAGGSLYPYELAETYAAYPDTIEVRARFETTGVVFEFK